MLYPSSDRHDSSRRGIAAVEFALLAPLLCFLLVITVDFARVFYYSVTVTNCARSGALYGCERPARAIDTQGISSAAKGDAGTLNASLMTVISAVDSSSNPTTLSVTVTYPFSTITNYVGVASQMTVRRTVQVNVSPLTPN